MLIDPAIAHAALEARDPRFDGRFFTGVASTGIYCRCICRARTPKPANRRFFASAAAAEAAGFRPCLLCRPELAPGLAPLDAPARLAAQAYARIEAGALEERGIEALAEDLGLTGRHLRRVMRASFGASPIQLAQTARLLMAKRLLADTSMAVVDVAFASGFQSLRRFNAAVKARYGLTPTSLRGRRAEAREASVRLILRARGKLDLQSSFAFLAARALPGVEVAGADHYARVLARGGESGWIAVEAQPSGLGVSLSDNLAPHLRALIAEVRGAFDLDSDLEVIDARLAAEPRLAGDVADAPGVRIPGALDGFDCAVRAVLGQQVSVAAARTLAGRLVARFGAAADGAPFGLARAFPSAQALAEAGADAIAAIGLPRKRAETLHRLALASADGRLTLTRGAIARGRAQLAAITGIGPWTIEYLALRALGDPDAYPATDAALIAALGRRGESFEHLRPWRAYAAIRLWRAAAAKGARP